MTHPSRTALPSAAADECLTAGRGAWEVSWLSKTQRKEVGEAMDALVERLRCRVCWRRAPVVSQVEQRLIAWCPSFMGGCDRVVQLPHEYSEYVE